MNLIAGLAVFIFGTIIGVSMLMFGFKKANDTNHSGITFLWLLFSAIGFCIIPVSFLAANYISLELKPF